MKSHPSWDYLCRAGCVYTEICLESWGRREEHSDTRVRGAEGGGQAEAGRIRSCCGELCRMPRYPTEQGGNMRIIRIRIPRFFLSFAAHGIRNLAVSQIDLAQSTEYKYGTVLCASLQQLLYNILYLYAAITPITPCSRYIYAQVGSVEISAAAVRDFSPFVLYQPISPLGPYITV